MIVAGTDVLIDGLRGRDPGRSRLAVERATGRRATTAITVLELMGGARERRERESVERLLAALTILAVDTASAQRLRPFASSSKRGEGTRDGRLPYRGHLPVALGVLLTRNREHFERVPGLALATMPPPGSRTQ